MDPIRHGYIRRFSVLLSGLFLCAFGNYLGVVAGVAGTNGWNTLGIGVADVLDTTFGKAGLIISAIVLLIGFLMKGKIGVGTLLNAVLLPIFSQIFLDSIPLAPASNQLIGTILSILGQFTFSVGAVLYMKSALGCGPRDTIMVVAGYKMKKMPIGAVKFIVETAVLIIGVLFGASFGLGTILTMVFQASIFQIVCMIMRFEPRSIAHEDVVDTYRNLSS